MTRPAANWAAAALALGLLAVPPSGFAQDSTSDAAAADAALARLEVDQRGLDAMDRRYLNCIALDFDGGPVGVETMAASLSEERDAIEDIIEPYLIQQAFLQRTPRGRVLTRNGYAHLGLEAPEITERDQAQIELLPLEGGGTEDRDV